jgi:hypothetical protein
MIPNKYLIQQPFDIRFQFSPFSTCTIYIQFLVTQFRFAPSPRLPFESNPQRDIKPLYDIPRSASAPPTYLSNSPITPDSSRDEDDVNNFIEVKGRYRVLEKIGEGTSHIIPF